MSRTRTIVFALLVTLLTAPLAAAQAKVNRATAKPTIAAHGNVEGVTAAQMKDFLTFIAADELEGRDAPSRGLDIAALYIANHLSRWGLKPAGENGSYFQPIALRRTTIDPQRSFTEINGQRFHYGDDFLATLRGGTATAQMVFVGHGFFIKAKKINAYEGIDVKDKIIITSNQLPKGITANDLAGQPGVDWANAQMYAEAHGAKGIIAVPSFLGLTNWAKTARKAVEIGTLDVEKFLPANVASIPIVQASPKFLTALFQGERQSAATIFSRALNNEAMESFALSAERSVTLNVAVNTAEATTKNIIAICEGSDPVLKNEYVAIGAHYDHVGMGEPSGNEGKFPGKDPADLIYNGADDDGSGTAAAMGMAEAFAKGQRPKRSILFVWHTAEEDGLWGARYFTEYPTVPVKQIVAQLNIDMIGRCRAETDTNPAHRQLARSNEVFLVGPKMMSTEIGEISESVNRAYLNLTFNYLFDDPKDPNQYFYRSDHFFYARKDIAVIFYTDGEHEDYHRPSDSVEKIDFGYMERVTRTIMATAWELANRAARPRVDKPLPATSVGD